MKLEELQTVRDQIRLCRESLDPDHERFGELPARQVRERMLELESLLDRAIGRAEAVAGLEALGKREAMRVSRSTIPMPLPRKTEK